uniref:Doublecortin domain-containing protein n=1 Tax=Latimeria chalumnae TaxID=7897 RepID=M3XHG7_LATCH
MSFISSTSSRHSSLEEILVKEYVSKIETSSSTSSHQLPRKYVSPYAKKAAINTGKKEHSTKSSFGPAHLQSVVISKRSKSKDCLTYQTSSDHSSYGASDSYSCTSNNTNNFSHLSSSKRHRPISAPSGQLRYTQFHLAAKYPLAGKVFEKPPVYKRQPWVIRVMAYKNGTRSVFSKIAASNIKMLLEESTEKLKLNTAARRVFLGNGTEAFEPKDIPHDSDVYISTGESFLDPFKKIQDHLSLSKKVNWTVNGVVLPADGKRGKTKPVLSQRMKKMTEKSRVRILIFKNGSGQDCCEVTASVDQMEEFLDACTLRLNLTSPAKHLYDWEGNKTEDIR